MTGRDINMILNALQENGAYVYNGAFYEIKDHIIDIPNEVARSMILSGQYTPISKYRFLNDKCKSMLLIRGSGLGDIMFCHAIRKAILKKYPKSMPL